MLVCRSPIVFFRLQLLNLVHRHQFHVSACCSRKRKWTKEQVSSIITWNYETAATCGPLLTNNAEKTISSARHNAGSSTGVNNHDDGDNRWGVETAACELKESALWTSDLPYSVSERISSDTVSIDVEEQISPSLDNSFNSHSRNSTVPEKCQIEASQCTAEINNIGKDKLFGLTKRENVCVYEWEDNPSQLPHGGKVDNVNDTAASEANTVEVISNNTEQSVNDNTVPVEINATVTEVHIGKDRTLANSSHQSVLSYPLFRSCASSDAVVSNVSARLPSVSAILKATMPPENQLALARWEQRMIAELGEDGFQQYKTTLFANGSNLHLTIHRYLSGKPEEELALLPSNQGHWRSIESVLGDITDVACLEKPLRHQQLGYCGVLDCIAEYRGDTYVIDWKTSKRRKSSIQQTFDNPLQLVAYLGAYNVQPSTPLQVERCLLVIGYEDGSAADVHAMDKWDCLQYWSSWLQRLHLFQTRTQSSS